jgi:hypothetical protein
VFLSSFIIKIPKSSKGWSIENKREREKVLKKKRKERKAPRVFANKKGESIF